MSDQSRRELREVEENYIKYFKIRHNRKEWRVNKDFKKEKQRGSKSGCPKKGDGPEPSYKLHTN